MGVDQKPGYRTKIGDLDISNCEIIKIKLWFPWASILNFDPGHQASKAERQVSSKRSVYSQDLSLEKCQNSAGMG